MRINCRMLNVLIFTDLLFMLLGLSENLPLESSIHPLSVQVQLLKQTCTFNCDACILLHMIILN